MSLQEIEARIRRDRPWALVTQMRSRDDCLVYADWLIEQADSRGELIVISMTNESITDPIERKDRHLQYQKHLQPFTDRAIAALPSFVKNPTLWCGFVVGASFEWKPGIGKQIATLLEDREMRFFTQIRWMRPGEETPSIEEVAHVEPTKVPHWSFEDCALEGPAIDVLTRARAWKGLVEISFERNAIGPDGAGALARGSFPDLASISLSHNPLEDAGGVELARAAWLPQIEALSLRECQLGEAAIARLLDRLVRLRRLSLDGNPAGDRAARELAARSHGPLVDLSLEDTNLGASALEMLVRAPHLATLTTLRMSRNALGDGVADALARTDADLDELDLMWNEITGRAVERLVEARALPALGSLRMGGNPLGNRGARAIGDAHHWTKLAHLDLVECGFDLEGLRAVLANPCFASLQTFHVRGNAIGNEGLAAIAKHRALFQLDVAHAGIEYGAFASLASTDFPWMGALRAGENRLSTEDVIAITERMKALWMLDLSNCGIGDEAVRVIARAKLPRLWIIGLSENAIGQDALQELRVAYPKALVTHLPPQ